MNFLNTLVKHIKLQMTYTKELIVQEYSLSYQSYCYTFKKLAIEGFNH